MEGVFLLVLFLGSSVGQESYGSSADQQNNYYTSNSEPPQRQRPTRPTNRPFLATAGTTSTTTYRPPPSRPVTRPTRFGSGSSTTPSGAFSPQQTSTSTRAPNSDSRLSYANCGVRPGPPPVEFILKAKPTYEGEFPWHAAIFTRESSASAPTYSCGGSLITKRAVLTAAHCVGKSDWSIKAADDVTVYLGKYLINEGWTIDRGVQSFTPQKMIIHPDYSHTNKSSDIAILTFSRDVKLSERVAVICLWNFDRDIKNLVGQYGTLPGWGLQSVETEVDITVLQKFKFPIKSYEECVRSKPDFFSTLLTTSNFCAGYTNGTSPCNGDSGGGLTFERDGRSYLRGIVSIGVPYTKDRTLCSPEHYTIYSDVAQYLAWIKRNVEGVNIIEPRR